MCDSDDGFCPEPYEDDLEEFERNQVAIDNSLESREDLDAEDSSTEQE